MTKEEVIREAWIAEIGKEKYLKVVQFQDEKGFIRWDWIGGSFMPYEQFNTGGPRKDMDFYIRPKSLSGIDDNNGWTKIDSESDLPKEKGNYFIVLDGEVITWYFNPSHPEGVKIWGECVSHYQSIKMPTPPLY